ncbi:MAG: prolipoprotein diacylglyceryl transferase [Nitrospirae bacterium]|nr:prolipoprotein diacylglyceryl transferase [Nitrospirota bacterium]
MFPVLIKIGPLTIHTYGFMIASAFLLGLLLALRQAAREGLPKDKITDLGFYALFSGIIGARILFIATNWPHFAEHPVDMIKIWEGGLVFYGGVIFALPTVIIYVKRQGLKLWQTIDVWAPSIAIGHALGRLGCFCAGCCYGKPADLPWAVTFSNPESLAILGVPLHPTQLYESAAELLNFAILILIRKKKTFHGQVFWMYVLNYSIIRALIELFRGDIERGFVMPGISTSQGISIVMFTTAVAFLVRLKRNKI